MWRRAKAKSWAEARRILGRYPKLYFALGGLRGEVFQKRKVTKDTDIVIDGYPRSTNSFAVGAFRHAQSTPVEIAHHLHVPAQIVRSCELGIPTILLIRHPVDAIVSYRALHREGEMVEGESRDPLRMGFSPFFRSWIDFYETTLDHRKSVVVALFDEVIRDFGKIVERVNSKYERSFHPFKHTDRNVRRVNEDRGYHAGPSDRRARLKEQVRENLERYRRADGDMIDEAVQLYESYKKESNVSE